MENAQITLTDDETAFAQSQGFSSAEAYVRDLIQHQRDIADLKAKLAAARVGPFIDADEAFFERLQRRISALA